MSGLRLYLRYLGISVRAQMQYRASFVMLSLGHLLVTAAEFAGIVVLFGRFGRLGTWRLEEVALFYGLISVAFALADAGARGFDLIGGQIKSGSFDRILLRPRAAALQIAGQELTLRRVGRLAQ
ncbi:MAG: ABC-2 family transporter protein, partial [Gemmatimonadota bacterium]